MSVLASCGLRSASRSILIAHAHRSITRPDQSNRGFSSTASRRAGLEDVFVFLPNTLLNAIHASGVIPWYLTIPTSAILVRGVFVYITSTRPGWMRLIKRQVVVPAVQASAITDSIYAERRQRTYESRRPAQGALQRSPNDEFRAWWSRNRELHRLGKLMGAPLFHPSMVLNFVVLISFMDNIRMMCGTTGRGLLTVLLSPFRWMANKVAHEPGTATSDAHDTTAATSQSQQDLPLNIGMNAASNDLAPDLIVADNPYFDPTLQTEGLAWCTNLCLPDPYYILPGLFFLSLTASNLLTVPMVPPRDGIRAPMLSTRQKGALGISAVFSLMSTGMPAALLLYWITNILVGWLANRWLSIKYPFPKPITPCKRPLRTRVVTKWKKAEPIT